MKQLSVGKVGTKDAPSSSKVNGMNVRQILGWETNLDGWPIIGNLGHDEHASKLIKVLVADDKVEEIVQQLQQTVHLEKLAWGMKNFHQTGECIRISCTATAISLLQESCP